MPATSPVVGGLLGIHKIISRGLGVSIQKCDQYLAKKGMPPEDAAGFSMYATTLKWVTHAHHLTEDEIAFPYLKDKIEAPYDRLSEDHRALARLLDNLDECVRELPDGGLARLRELLDQFNTLWGPHIKIEEEHLTSERMHAVAGMQEQAGLAKQFAEHSGKHSGPGPLAVPFMFYNLEGIDRERFTAPFPFIVRRVLVPIVWRKAWTPMKPFLLV